MVGLTTDQAAKMENNALSFITLSEDGGVGVLECRKLLLVALSLTLKLLGNLLLENKGFKSIVTLLLSSREAGGEASCIVLLLVNETSKASIFTLVVLNLDLEVLSLFGELFGEGLELKELHVVSKLKLIKNKIKHTCCFQLSSSSTRKLFLLVTLPSSVSMRPLRLMKSCQASRASLEY